MKLTILIQVIEESDLDEIVALGKSTPELQVTDGTPGYYPKENLASFIKSPHDIYLKATVEGFLAGYQLATINPYLKEAYLIDLVVKKEFRKSGVATLLLQKTSDLLKEKGCSWAWGLVQEKNTDMMDFLEKRGFIKGISFRFFYKLPPFSK